MTEKKKEGNNKAMREALEYILKERDILDFCHNNLGSKTWEDWDKVYKVLRKIIEKSMRALAAPLRNGDVGTPEEQRRRYDEWRNHDELREAFGKDEFEWAQMPYERGIEE